MTFLRRDGNAVVFAIEDWERAFLVAVLRHYPQIPPGSFVVSKGRVKGAPPGANAWHGELLASEQQSNRSRVLAFITNKLLDAAHPESPGLPELSLKPAESDWLLRVLNDVRVGSWIKLGRPDEPTLRKLARAKESPASIDVMEFCGHVQAQLIEVLRLLE